MTHKACKHTRSPRDQLLMIDQLSEKDEEFGHQSAHTPDNDLYDPSSNIDLLIRVKIILSVHWHIFISIHSTFENLLKYRISYSYDDDDKEAYLYVKLDGNLVNDLEKDICEEYTKSCVAEQSD